MEEPVLSIQGLSREEICMSWWKNGMLLLAGGAIGICLAAMIEARSEKDRNREGEDNDELPDGITLLVSKIRYEAEAAMESCASDEEREAVYAQVKGSIRQIEATLNQKGEEIIAALQAQAFPTAKSASRVPAWMDKDGVSAQPVPKWMLKDPDNSVPSQSHVQGIKDTMQKMTDVLEETLDSLKPDAQVPGAQA